MEPRCCALSSTDPPRWPPPCARPTTEAVGRLLILSLSLACWSLDRLTGGLRRLLGRPCSPTGIVLFYHAVPPQHRAAFAAQMDRLQRWSTPVHCDFTGPFTAGEYYSAVTFDDAFQSVVDEALPELEERGIPTTIFAPSGALDGPPPWPMLAECPDSSETIVQAETLARIQSPLVKIGSHTVNHARLPEVPVEQARSEISDSRTTLERVLGTPVTTLAFPYGAHDEQTLELCRAAGYEHVFTILPLPAFPSRDPFVVGRVGVDPWDSPLEFRLKAQGAYRWRPWAARIKRALRPGGARS
ncbi:MAG: peptidoglycan/xylan/chitin deacetylase (PgdA/CDA1 family) [Chlamydiales bacterium]|jgi:peptidoglycan/xylan/chitin deacetylase (PgdA/CDA1 family)